ncbi:DUF4270 domain-containing protein [Riemerella anatipestifer]|uniref:DUF4270 domain-containing protein n=1 Tax=Riemerella anatipestifer TaxID=34085 RepID=UPI00069991CB|nr:DUF4270 domain-containing protein [Riemerella anatipestifer]
MIIETKKIFKLFVIAGLGSLGIQSCESEANNLGEQFFASGAATGETQSYDVIAYNLNNNDTIQSDASRISQATLGAFTEDNFGMQKSSYVTQLRLLSYNPDYGTNAKVDSVVLELKPIYASDSATTSTDENYVFTGNVAAKKVVTTYPIQKYGNNKPLTLKVDEVDDFLYSTEKKYYSNQKVALGVNLATVSLDGKVSSVSITSDADNKELLSRTVGIRIPLDAQYFQDKIVNKQGSTELKDAASFIRHIKGIKLSVVENDGYILKFYPNDVSIKMYYTYDTTSNGTTTKTSSVYQFDLGSSNVHFNQIDYNRPSAYSTAMTNVDKTNGDERLYLQGMGGAGAVLKIPSTEIQKIKNLYKNENIGILSAKIRLYTDDSVWNKSYAKPSNFLVKYANLNDFLDDVSAMSLSSSYSLVKTSDLTSNPAYYDITITQTLKNIIEKEAENKDLEINVGDYLKSTQGTLLGQKYNTRAYAPQRIVLVGSKTANQNKVKLNIIYAKK